MAFFLASSDFLTSSAIFGAGEGLFAVLVFGAPCLDLLGGDGLGFVVEGAADVGEDAGEFFCHRGRLRGEP